MATKKTSKTTKKPATKAKKPAVAKKPATKASAKPAAKPTTKVATVMPAQVKVETPPTTLSFKKPGMTIPIRSFVPWSVAAIVVISIFGFWIAQTLVKERTSSLHSSSIARVALKAEGKAAVLSEWLHGVLGMADNVTESDLVRLFTAEIALEGIAEEIGEEQKKHNVALSVHAPYYINLLSKEKEKVDEVINEYTWKALRL